MAVLAGWSIGSSAPVCSDSSDIGSTSISCTVGSGCRDLAADEGGCRTDSSCAFRCSVAEQCEHCAVAIPLPSQADMSLIESWICYNPNPLQHSPDRPIISQSLAA